MSRKDHLLFMIKFNLMVAKRLLEDVTDDESMKRGGDNLNHIRWLAGHILATEGLAFAALGHPNEDDRKYHHIFATGSVISDDPATYPSMANIRAMLYKSHEQLAELVSRQSDADLEKEIGEGDRRQPLWQRMTFLEMHEFYHFGQITQMRHSLGRPRPFA